MKTHTAKVRVCVTKAGELCKESDPRAAFFFAAAGAQLPESRLVGRANAAAFFDGFDAAEEQPEQPEQQPSKRVEPPGEDHSARKGKHR